MLSVAPRAHAAPASAIDTRVPPHIRIVNASLIDGPPDSPGGLVLAGKIDQATLRFLNVDFSYQRELQANREKIMAGLRAGATFPPIDIGVRGEAYETDQGDVIINSPAFIIDGYQRTGTALELLDAAPQTAIRFLATVHFNTTREWENDRFNKLNFDRIKMSPNHRLRNMREKNAAILTLYGLSKSETRSPVYELVTWGHNVKKGELITALVLCKTALQLHFHITTARDITADALASSLLLATQRIGLETFRRNVSTFFAVVDECWPLRGIMHRRAAPQIKGPFLYQLARVFSDHLNFWDQHSRVLFVNADDRRKLAAFSLTDPQIAHLAGAGGTAGRLLYRLMVDHINSGRRSNRLVPRIAEDAA